MHPVLQLAFDHWIFHPLGYCVGTPSQVLLCKGYNFWSGIGACFISLTLITGLLAFYKHHNCHHKRCWRPGHKHPVHGWPACKTHYHDVPEHV